MADKNDPSSYFVPDFSEEGGGKKSKVKNWPRSTRIIWIVTLGIAAVLGIVVYSMDDGQTARDAAATAARTAPPTVAEVKQASGFYSNADVIREMMYRNLRDQIAAEVTESVSADAVVRTGAAPAAPAPKPTRVVHMPPSPEYVNALQKGVTAFTAPASVQLSVGQDAAADEGGAASGAAAADTLAQLLSPLQQTLGAAAAAGGAVDAAALLPGGAGEDGNATSAAHQNRMSGYVAANTNTGAANVQAEYLSSTRRAPLSEFELKAGTIISGVMVGGINSDLPGVILGQVTENVFDTATGSHLLIPQGSRMVGAYDSNVVYGQNRLLVVWNRIVFPDGTSLNLEGMLGSDQRGYAGFKQKVDHHYSRMLGAALFASVFVAAGKEATKDDRSGSTGSNGETVSTESVFAEAVMENVTNVATQMIEKNMNIAPTLRILPGYRFSIVTTKDVSFAEPYVAASGGGYR